jgi:hypothetical protein
MAKKKSKQDRVYTQSKARLNDLADQSTQHQDKLPSEQDETPIETVLQHADDDEIRGEMGQYSQGADTIDEFTARQEMSIDSERLLDQFEEYSMQSPRVSAGDIDDPWDEAVLSGKEMLKGDSPTPDQDVVDELGAAAGITYGLKEPLNFSKIADHDRRRWKLNLASSEDREDEKDARESDLNREDELDQLADLADIEDDCQG